MTFNNLLLAFSGGVFGALVGGTISFTFTGLMALIGIGIVLAGGSSTFSNEIAFGPFFGPHTAFVGAVAGAALAGKIESCEVEGSDVNTPLFRTKSVAVLLVSGLFGVIGYSINYLFVSNNLPMDTIACTVAICGVLTRLFVARDSVFCSGENTSDANVLFDAVWAAALGLLTGFAVKVTGVNNIAWAFSAFSLIYAFTSAKEFPTTHHITMSAGFAAATFNNIYIAMLYAIGASVLGHYINKYTNVDKESHIDMPAVVILIASLLTLPFAK